MKICTASSARGYTCQIGRIEQGFIDLGHEITPHAHEADLVYVNNPWFDQVIKDKKDIKGKIIFNILDIPTHLFPQYDLVKLTNQLKQADAVTSISTFVQGQVKTFCELDSTVIYQPIMNVSKQDYAKHKPWKYLFIGRLSDPNKRTSFALRALEILKAKESEVVCVGPESLWFGDNRAIINESELSDVYNMVDFVFCLGKVEGICLPMIEAMACGAIPIVCQDLTTREEFLPSYLFPEYNSVYGENALSIVGFIQNMDYYPETKEAKKEFLHRYYRNNWEEKFSQVGVAKKILEVYGRL